VAALALAGCGGESAAQALEETAANLPAVHGGAVSGRLAVDVKGGEDVDLRLSPRLAAPLRALLASGVDLSAWVENPRLDGTANVDGVETDHVRGSLDLPAVIDDLVVIGRTVGLTRALDVDALRQAGRSGTVDVYTGSQDRLLRRLLIQARFGLNVPDGLSFGPVLGADVTLDVTVSHSAAE
jgi:hypothetical protein